MGNKKDSSLAAVLTPHQSGSEEPKPHLFHHGELKSREAREIRHVDAVTLVQEECECAMIELNSYCMTRRPDFKAIVHQLSRLRECKASREAVRKAVLQHLTFQVACSPKAERDQTLKNWSCILTFPIVRKWLEMSIQQYQTAVTEGYRIRETVKNQISGMRSVTDADRFNQLVMEGIVLKVLNTDLGENP